MMASSRPRLEAFPTEVLLGILRHFAPSLPPMNENLEGYGFSPQALGIGVWISDDDRNIAQWLEQSQDTERMLSFQQKLLLRRGFSREEAARQRLCVPCPQGEGLTRHLDSSKTLCQLCLVSKRFVHASRELLYKNLVIFKPEELLLLWRTIRQNGALGGFIRQLDVRFVLSKLAVTRMAAAVHKTLPQYQSLGGDWAVYQETFDELNKISLMDINHPDQIPECDVPARTFADILGRCPNLVKLSLQVPAFADSNSAYKELHSSIASSNSAPQALELCYRRSGPNHRNDIAYLSFNPFDYRALLELPSLTRVTFSGSLLVASAGNLDQDRHGWAASIREVHLDGSGWDSRVLSLIIRAAVRLERLSINALVGLHQQSCFMPWANPESIAALNEPLILRAQTLRVLHIGAKGLGASGFGGFGFRAETLESGRNLQCIPLLDHLEELCLPMKDLTTTGLAGELPESLRSLILDDTVLWMSPNMSDEYRNDVKSSLAQICNSVSAKKLPNLERVQYMWEFMNSGPRNIIVDMKATLDDLQTSFREVGVKFSWARDALPISLLPSGEMALPQPGI